MIESILSLSLFKKYSNSLEVRNLKTITNQVEGNLDLYKELWRNLLNYEIFCRYTPISASLTEYFPPKDYSPHEDQLFEGPFDFIFESHLRYLIPS